MNNHIYGKKLKRTIFLTVLVVAILLIGIQGTSFGNTNVGEYTETELNDAYNLVNDKLELNWGYGIEKEVFLSEFEKIGGNLDKYVKSYDEILI